MLVLLPVAAAAVVVPLAEAQAEDPPTGSVVRANLRSDGSQSLGSAASALISSDGSTAVWLARFVTPVDDDPVPGPAPDVTTQLYARDLDTGRTDRISVSDDGRSANNVGISGIDVDADGDAVVFGASGLAPGATDFVTDVFLRDRNAGTSTQITVGLNGGRPDGSSGDAHLSDDGRWVVFISAATNLVLDPPDPAGTVLQPGFPHVYLYDVQRGTTSRLSPIGPSPIAGEAYSSYNPSISADGSTVVYLRQGVDPVTGESRRDAVFVLDRASGTTELLQPENVGLSAGSRVSLSGNGRYAAFRGTDSRAYLLDRQTRALTLLSQGLQAPPSYVELSDDARTAFLWAVGDLPGGGRGLQLYLRDVPTGTLTLFHSFPFTGGAPTNTALRSLSGDASRVAFLSTDAGLVPGDTNGVRDLFVRTYEPPPLPGSLAVQLDGSGTAVSSGSDATAQLPVVATIAPPAGATGRLTVVPVAGTGQAPAGFATLAPNGGGAALAIEGPAVSAADPYELVLTVDTSLLGGIAARDVQVLRNGGVVPDCAAAGASPDPCVVSRTSTPDGDAVLEVLTSHFSRWELGRYVYDLAGPFRPVDPMPVVNTVKGGSAVPVKFGLGGNRGLDVLAAGYPKTMTVPCAGATDAVEQTVSANSPALSYDGTSGQYTYVWKTPRTTGCRDLVLRFRDGSELTSRFLLR
jgi:hypothetical protein